jgi:hypothetical protein
MGASCKVLAAGFTHREQQTLLDAAVQAMDAAIRSKALGYRGRR